MNSRRSLSSASAVTQVALHHNQKEGDLLNITRITQVPQTSWVWLIRSTATLCVFSKCPIIDAKGEASFSTLEIVPNSVRAAANVHPHLQGSTNIL